MSDLQKKAAEYANMVENYKQLSISPAELGRYHSISEQQFDKVLGELEDALQEDIKDVPDVLTAFDKILKPFKRIFK